VVGVGVGVVPSVEHDTLLLTIPIIDLVSSRQIVSGGHSTKREVSRNTSTKEFPLRIVTVDDCIPPVPQGSYTSYSYVTLTFWFTLPYM
jgi:hypothetical protein